MKENKTNELEFSANEILKNMSMNTFNNFQSYDSSSINQNYLNLRNSIFNIIQKITMRFGFKSQTFFLTAYYLDIIFIKKKKIHINLYKLGLACLCLSSKFCENDPIVPHLQYFVKAYNGITGYKNFISMNELMHTEVIVCKILKYKLNYFTIYDFIAFFFCHGIFKFEQIREIQKEIDNNSNNKKENEFNNEEFELDTIFVKNILGKIYRTVRNYLDVLIKIDKICFKYNPLYISIYLIEKSMIECLEKEYKKCKGNIAKEDLIKDINKFSKKNKIYFKEIMNEFYKIHYENNEQYLQLLTDNEINCIFVSEKKNINKQVIETDNNKEDKNKLFNSTMTNGFYKRLKLQLNNDKSDKPSNNIINKEKNNIISKEVKKQEDIENSENNLETEDDLNTNLNINQLQKTINSKKATISKISLTKKFHKISMNKINYFDKTESNKTLDLKTEKTKSIKNLKYKDNNLRNTHSYLKMDTSSSFKTLKNDSKPYSRKLPSGNNRNIIKSFHESLKASTSTNFYPSKLKNVTNTENNSELNKTTSYLKMNDKTKEKQRIINTAITKKYKKIVNNNSKDFSSKSIRSKKLFKEKFDNKTFSATGENFYSSKPIFKKISVNKINPQKDSEIPNLNINKELRTKKLSSNFYKNNSSINTSYKEENKISQKNYANEFKMKINTNITNNDNKETIDDKAKKYKKISYSKIHNDYIQAKSDKKKEIKRIIFKSRPNDNAIKEGYSFKTLNSINNGPSNEKQFKTINKELSISSNNNSNIQTSGSTFYNLIQKTKQFFKKEKEINDSKKTTNKNINSYKKVEPSKSFYTSKKNFYKKDNKIKDNNKEKEINKGNTIIINNNININFGNKKDIKIAELNLNNTIVTSGKNNINLNNKFNTQRIGNNNEKLDNNTNEDNKATIMFKNIFQKFHFNKKVINKNNK